MERLALRRLQAAPHTAVTLGLAHWRTFGEPLPTPLETASQGNVIPFPINRRKETATV